MDTELHKSTWQNVKVKVILSGYNVSNNFFFIFFEIVNNDDDADSSWLVVGHVEPCCGWWEVGVPGARGTLLWVVGGRGLVELQC